MISGDRHHMSLPLRVSYSVEFSSQSDAQTLFFCQNDGCMAVAVCLRICRPWRFHQTIGTEHRQASAITNTFGQFDVRPFCNGCAARERERLDRYYSYPPGGHGNRGRTPTDTQGGQIHIQLPAQAKGSTREDSKKSGGCHSSTTTSTAGSGQRQSATLAQP